MHAGEIRTELGTLRERARIDPRIRADLPPALARIGRWSVGLTANL